MPRFEALAYVLPHFDALTHVVIRVSWAFIFQTFAEVCALFCLRTGIEQFTTEHGMLDSTAFFWEEEGGVQQTRGHQISCVLSYLKTKINRCIFLEKFSLTLSSYPPPPVSFLL